MKEYNSEISGFLENKGIGLYGFADLSNIPLEQRSNLPRSISFAFPIRKEIVRQIVNGPTPDYYNEYVRLNELLFKTGKEIEEHIRAAGFQAIALEATAKILDLKTLAVTLPHKTSATLAGLGWIGKSDLLITGKFGSAMRLSTVLTDIPLTTGKPIEESKCGDCVICVKKCPAKAIKGVNWKRGMKREEIYDAYSCKKKADELSKAADIRRTICGICIANCPHTIKYLGNEK